MTQLPVAQFLTDRLKEYDPNFEVRSGTGFEQLFFKPLQFLLQPIVNEAVRLDTSQSFRKILLQEKPDEFSEDAVDALASNLFVDRATGNRAGGTARLYHASAVAREWPSNGMRILGSNNKSYSNPAPFIITAAQMSTQIEGGNFYYDVPVLADEFGEDSDLDIGGLITIENDPETITVTNKARIEGGRARETNTELIERIRRSIAVRDLVTGKGFNAILFENFVSFLTELQPIGFGDDEMMRDIVFNTHIGGKVDGYFKASNIKIGSKDFVGVLTDFTRQSYASTNVQLVGTAWSSLSNTDIDRTGGKNPIVQQVKPAKGAKYLSTVDLSSPIDLSLNQYVRIEVDGVSRNIKVAGVSPASTSRSEIISLINAAFGYNVVFALGSSFETRSPTRGLTSQVVIDNPTSGTNALTQVFGLSTGTAPHIFNGDGPITFLESTHYDVDDPNGNLRRVIGSNVIGTSPVPLTSGVSLAVPANPDVFNDPTLAAFLTVVQNDILTITAGPDAGDYRVVEKLSNNSLLLDADLTTASAAVNYYVHRTGIKDGEVVFAQYYFNPLAIDIGPLVKLDTLGKIRGIRPGREDMTITDVAFLRIRKIEVIDPITKEPTGQILEGGGGYGYGGYGEGPYGIGSGTDYYVIVNSPVERFSAFEDSLIVLNSGLIGLSFNVEYEYAPECLELHNFVRSENERVLDGDFLMKHFLPAYVKGTIEYKVDKTDSSIPDNDTLTQLVRDFVNKQRSGTPLKYSDLYQFIARTTDPFDRYGSFVKPFQLTAMIHNADGSTTVITGDDQLEVPTPNPFPKSTPRPLSPRITHWIATDTDLQLVRL